MTHTSHMLGPDTVLYHDPTADVTDEVVIHSRGRFRTARAIASGPRRVKVEYTPIGSNHSTKKYVPRSEIYSLTDQGCGVAGKIARTGSGNAGHELV